MHATSGPQSCNLRPASLTHTEEVRQTSSQCLFIEMNVEKSALSDVCLFWALEIQVMGHPIFSGIYPYQAQEVALLVPLYQVLPSDSERAWDRGGRNKHS